MESKNEAFEGRGFSDDEDCSYEVINGTAMLAAMCGDYDRYFKEYTSAKPRWGKLAARSDYVRYDEVDAFGYEFVDDGISYMSAIPPSDPRYDYRLFLTFCYQEDCWEVDCGLKYDVCPDAQNPSQPDLSQEEKRIRTGVKSVMLRMQKLMFNS